MKKILLYCLSGFLPAVLFSQTYLVPFSGTDTANSCSGTVYDHAGTSGYSNGANGILTLYPQNAGTFVSLSFLTFALESGFDYVYIYDGVNTSAPLIGSYTGSNSPGNVYATNSYGAITIRFTTDGSVTSTGFEATISCVASVPLADLIILTPTLGSGTAVAGNSVSYNYYAKNQGGAASLACSTGFYLSANNQWDLNDTYLSSQYISSVSSGLSTYYSGSVTIPTSTTNGNYYILFYADYTDIVNEDNDSNNVNSVPIAIVTPVVDLYISNPAASPATVVAGGSVSASGYEYNQGNSNVTSNAIGYYLSADIVWDVNDVFLASTTSSTIYQGSYYYFSQNCTIPSATAPGNYYLLYYADYTGAISESNENNNINIVAITVTSASKDLSVATASASPSTVAYGSNTTLSFSVLNQGYQPTSTSVGFYLSTDSLWDVSDTYLSYFTLSSIAANSFYSTSTSLTIPSGTTPGNYYILSYVDYTGAITETNENNNVKPVAVTVTAPVIDLLVQTPTLSPTTISAGSSVSVTCYIFNQGTTSSSYSNVGYYLSSDNVFDAGDVYLNYSSGSTLAAGSSSYRSSTLTIPSSTTPGSYHILYFADYSSMVTESNENNNVNSLSITISSPYTDLAITSQYNPTSTTAGSSISINCYIINNGNTTATYSNVGYYLSSDYLFDAGDTYLGFSSGSSLGAGSSGYRSATVTIPTSVTPGNYYILYYADYSNMVNESNENNNVSYLTIIIGGGPAYTMPLTGSNSITTCSGMVYDDGGSSAYYSNNSNGTLTINPQTAGNYVGLSFSTFSTQSGYDYLYIYNGTSTADPLIGSYSGSSNPGTVYATGSTGALTLVFSSNTSTTYAGFAASILCSGTTPAADLYIQSNATISSSTVAAGASISGTCYIANMGTNSATSSNVGYYLSADSAWDASDTYLNYSSGSTLNAGSSSYRSATLTIPSSTTPGSYYILFYADYANQVSESSEINNIEIRPITVNASVVDLAIISTTLSSSNLTAGSTATATCYIINNGNSTASSSNVGYYLSTDSAWDASDVYLNYSTGTSLTGGSSSYRSSTLTIPSATGPGTYYILYFADYSNTVSESNENNNVSLMTITVVTASIDLTIVNYYLSASTVAQAGTFTANCYILNQGNTSVATSNVGFYLSADSTWDASDTYLNYQAGTTLNANSYSSRSRSLTLPGSATPGSYYLLYYADYSNMVSENIETNNVVFSAITIVSPVVDLVIISPTAYPASAVAGSSVTLVSSIYNNGNSAATYSNIGYYLSTDTLFDASDTYLSYSSGSTLNAGTGAQKSSTVTIPSSTTPGNYYLLFFADYSYMVVEGNESNNVKYVGIAISAPVIDLYIQSPSLSVNSVVPCSTFTSYCYIYNQGNATATSSNIGYYLSTDTTWDASDTYLNYYSGGTLLANASSYRSLTLTMPCSTATGNYYILFFADYSNSVSETNETNNVNYVAITVANPFVDLVIQNTTLSPTSVTAGTSVSVTCYILNQGNSSASSSNVGYYLSADTAWDVSDIYLAYSAGTSLAGGSSAYKSTSLTIPSSTIPGSYYILYFADYSGSVTESVETNNVAYRALTIVSPNIDLIIQTPGLTSSNVTAGGTTTASCYIYNQGTTTASISSVGFYLSVNTTWDASDVFLNYQTGGALTSGSSSYRSALLTIPSSTTPGSYYILYYADYLNAETESVETNNVSSMAITVSSPSIDLIIQSPYAPSTGVAGSTISVNCYIYNQGNTAAASSNAGYYLSANNVYDASDVYLGYSSGASLAAGSSSYRSATLTIPSSTLPGNYYIIYYADYSNTVSETNENNNTNYYSITISTPSIDLLIQSPYSPASGTAGNSISVSCYIYNQGTSSSASSNVGYYLSTDAAWDAGDTYLNYSSGSTLTAGTSSYRSATVAIPSSTTPGNYYILFYADYSNAVSETNESNNVNYAAINISIPSIDLVIISPYVYPSTMAAGDNISVDCYIYNQGTISATYSYVGYYLSTDTTWDASDVYLNYSYGGTLSAGASAYRSATLAIPTGTTPGNYYVLYFADNNYYVSETNENNNVNYLSISVVVPSVDLIIQSPNGPPSGFPGSSYSVSCYIHNQGTAASASSNVGFYISADTIFDAGDTYLNYSYNGSLAAGTSSYETATIIIPTSISYGNYYLLYFADYDFQASETNEGNNVNYTAINIAPAYVDLVIQSPNAPASGIIGNTVSVYCYINNLGNIASSYSDVGYYLSTDTTWDAGDIYLNYSAGSSLTPGSSSYRSATVTIPGSTNPGNYYLLFFADYSLLVAESIETNNVSNLPIMLVPSGVDLVIISPTLSSGTVMAGSTVFATDYIYNQGNANSASSNVGYYLSADTTWDASDIYLNNSAGGSLSWGLSSYKSANLSIPSNTMTGNYYILYYADYSGLVSEINEINNVVFLPISVNGLFITLPVTGSNSVTTCSDTLFDDGGPSANYANSADGSLTIYPVNNGDKVTLSFFDFSMENGWDFLYIYDGVNIGAPLIGNFTGTTSPGTITSSLTNTSGALTLRLTSDASINSLGFAAGISCVTPPAYPDLTVLNNGTVTPNQVPAGDSVIISCDVSNQGNAVANANAIGYYLSPDTMFDLSDIYLASDNITSLASGTSDNIISTVAIPVSVTPGNYFILLYADYSTLISESDEGNNTLFIPIVVDSAVIGISENRVGLQFEIYPNPNQGAFEIRMNFINNFLSYDIEIVDITGKKVLKQNNISKFQHKLVMNNYEPGIYFLMIKTADGIMVRKLVVN